MENLVAPAPKWPATKLAATKLQRRKVLFPLFAGRIRPKDLKNWYSQLPCLTFGI